MRNPLRIPNPRPTLGAADNDKHLVGTRDPRFRDSEFQDVGLEWEGEAPPAPAPVPPPISIPHPPIPSMPPPGIIEYPFPLEDVRPNEGFNDPPPQPPPGPIGRLASLLGVRRGR
jgi:hypothetical protein